MNLEYSIALTLSAIVSTVITVMAWRRRSAAGATGLGVAMLGLTIWALTYAIRWSMSDQAAQFFWLDATYLGVVTAPTAFLVLTLQFVHKGHWLTRRNLVLFAVEPLLTLLILWTDTYHGLFYAGLQTTGNILNGGVWFWINATYSYVLLLIAAGYLTRAFLRGQYFQRQQAGTLLLGMLLPWLGNIISLARLSPFPDLDLTPFIFILSGLVFSKGLFQYHLLDIVPVARDSLVEGMRDGVIVLDARHRIVDINPAGRSIINIPANHIGQPVDTLFVKWPELREMFSVQGEARAEIQILAGQLCHFEVSVSMLLDRRHKLNGWLMILHDITGQKQAENALRKSEERFRSVIQSAMDAIITTDNNGKIVSWNRGAAQIFQYSEEEILGQTLSTLIPETYWDQHKVGMEQLFAGGEPHLLGQKIKVYGLQKDGTVIPVELVLSRWQTENEEFFTAIIRDITERQKMEDALQFQSTHDILTGLHNRQFFEMEIDRFQQSQQFPISILMIDVDDLKKYNDTMGHAAGDDLLRRAAQVLKASFRREDRVARIGGDEFVIILPNTDFATAMKIVERFKNLLNEHNQGYPANLDLSLSVGMACGEENSAISELLIQADQAMYDEKEKKKIGL